MATEPSPRAKRRRPNPWILVPLALISLVLGSLYGVSPLDLGKVLDLTSTDHQIFFELRLPRALVAFLAGSGLAACGMMFQALFLNSMATPFTLGVAGGASCGAATVIFIGGLPGLYTGPSVTLGAVIGASAAISLVLAFGRTRMGHQRHVVLLAGVAVSFFFSSLLLFIQSMSSFYQSFQIIRWLMGGISVVGYREVLLLAPILLPGFALILAYRSRLNLLMLGDDLAQSRGLNVRAAKQLFFIVTSIMVAAIVSVTGPIGFVGMVAPHICRLIFGGNHRQLAPATILLGGSVLVLCDLAGRTLLAPIEIPVGVITSIIGAPFFFFLLLHRRYRF